LAVYNKAIRDRIPDIIKESENDCVIKQLSNDDFLLELEKKLEEELKEYQESKSAEELADILEVIYRISELRGIRRTELETIQNKKRSERGGFEKNLFLIETKDKLRFIQKILKTEFY